MNVLLNILCWVNYFLKYIKRFIIRKIKTLFKEDKLEFKRLVSISDVCHSPLLFDIPEDNKRRILHLRAMLLSKRKINLINKKLYNRQIKTFRQMINSKEGIKEMSILQFGN